MTKRFDLLIESIDQYGKSSVEPGKAPSEIIADFTAYVAEIIRKTDHDKASHLTIVSKDELLKAQIRFFDA